MLPASGGNLSGGCNSAGSSSYDLTSSGILLELNFFKVHFIGWSPSDQLAAAGGGAGAGHAHREGGAGEAHAAVRGGVELVEAEGGPAPAPRHHDVAPVPPLHVVASVEPPAALQLGRGPRPGERSGH